jgi:hypothetical protein
LPRQQFGDEKPACWRVPGTVEETQIILPEFHEESSFSDSYTIVYSLGIGEEAKDGRIPAPKLRGA